MNSPVTKDRDTSCSVCFLLSFKPLVLFCSNSDDVQNGTFPENFNGLEIQSFGEEEKKNTEKSKKIVRFSILYQRRKELM